MLKRTQSQLMVKFFADAYYVAGSSVPHINVSYDDLFSMSENHVFRNPKFYKQTIADKVINKDTGETRQVTLNFAKFLVMRNDKRTVTPEDSNVVEDFLTFGIMIHFVEPKDPSKFAHLPKIEVIFGAKEFHYKDTLRSASQARQAKFLCTDIDMVGEVRTHASYGWVDRLRGRVFKTVAKIEPYIGLALSSTLPAGKGYTDINIYDYETELNMKGALTQVRLENGETKIVNYEEHFGKDTMTHEITDGQSIISPKALVKAMYEIRVIYKSEYKRLMKAFADGIKFADQLVHEELGRIWNKIPMGIQFRYGLKKGFAIVIDHDYTDRNGNQFDFVFPNGADKGEVKRYRNQYVPMEERDAWMEGFNKEVASLKKNGAEFLPKVVFRGRNYVEIDNGAGASDNDVELAIANVATRKEKNWAVLNYQFIQALNLSFEEVLKPLSAKAIRKISSALNSVEEAKVFLGMIDNGDAEEYGERNHVQNVRSFLDAHQDIFGSKWIRKSIIKLMNKSVQDMAKGRIPIEDSRYVYIIADPNTLLKNGQPILKAGEYYWNGEVGTRAIFRSPLIHKSEAVKIELVNRPELEEAFGHMKNVLIMNVFDDTLPRMGGADTDGDKVFMTSEELIVNAVETGLPLVFGDTETQKLEAFAWEEEIIRKKTFQYNMGTSKPSQIGIVTDYCTSIADKARDTRTSKEKADEFWNLVVEGRITQGKIIDDAKSGTTTNIPENIETKFFPTWLRGERDNTYKSQSPMGKLHAWINEVAFPYFEKNYGTMDPTYKNNILSKVKGYEPIEVERIQPEIAKMESAYRTETRDLFTHYEERIKSLRVSLLASGVSESDIKDFTKELEDERGKEFEKLIEGYQTMLASLDASTAMIGMAAINVAENIVHSSADKVPSFPYVVAGEYVKAMLRLVDGNTKLVRVHDADGGLWTEQVRVENRKDAVMKKGEYHVIRTGIVYVGEEVVGEVHGIEDGEYKTYAKDNQFFLRVPVQSEAKEEVERSREQVVSFNIKGFKRFNTTLNEVQNMVLSKVVTLKASSNKEGNWINLIHDGKEIGSVGKETIINGAYVEGKQLEVISVQPIKGILKATARVVGDEVIVKTESAPVEQTEAVEEPASVNSGDDFMNVFFGGF